MKELKFTKTHEWVEINGNTALIGLSDYAANALGDIVYISLPNVGDKVSCDKSFSDVESVKSVSPIESPVCGTIVAVNDELADHPELINDAPYASWIIKVEFTKIGELMTKQQYDMFITK